jgi:hypothetical protein
VGIVGTGDFSTTGNVTAGNIVGTLVAPSVSISGNILTGGLISAAGNITAGNLNAAGLSLSSNVVSAINSTSDITTTANISGGNILGTVIGNLTGATISSSGNITGGNLLSDGLISSTGDITAANYLTSGLISATGNITGGNILGGANVNATTHTGTTVSVTGTITGASVVGGVITGSSVSVSGTVIGGGITGSSLTVSTGSITGGNIINGNGNGIGNIGSSSAYFNTVFAMATSAQYADLAEKYLADAEYEIGTVLAVGGDLEVTACVIGDRAIGAVSENPAYKMNDGLANGTYVALKGRVPVKVIGPVRKGQRLVAHNNGCAVAGEPHTNDVFAVALESNNSIDVKLIEAVIL